jgi:hypothetical protein
MKMKPDENLQQWSNAHAFYSMYLQDVTDPFRSKEEFEWRHWAVNETRNGHLVLKNSFFDTLKTSSKIYLFHVTPNLPKVLESGVLYSSGGCLVGSIYATPLYPYQGVFRPHNLGEYIYRHEAPRATYLQSKDEAPGILILEVDLPERAHDNLIGIDYTKLGSVHLAIYKDLEYLLSLRERVYLQEIVVNKIKQALCMLNIASNYQRGEPINIDHFFELYLSAIDQLPILGYLYFEVIAEYLMLFEDHASAREAHEKGEIYNASYKNIMFDIFPELLRGAGLGHFKPTPAQVVAYIRKYNIISKFDESSFLQHLANRTIYMVRSRLFNGKSEAINWRALKWDIKDLEVVASPLLGHLVHRELRNFGRFPDFYFYFDQVKALQAWNYWNQMGVVIPFNGVMPKGEIGVNPALPDLSVRVYVGKEVRGSKNESLLVEIEGEVPVKIVPRLIDHRVSLMRSRAKQDIKELIGSFRD